MQRIVSIEDEVDMLDLMALILTRKGFEFHSAQSGLEGLKLIEQVQPDLILLDLMMPDMIGWEVYDRLKAAPQTHAIPVLIVTARTQSDPRLVAFQEQTTIDDLITKPFGPSQLVEKVMAILKRTP